MHWWKFVKDSKNDGVCCFLFFCPLTQTINILRDSVIHFLLSQRLTPRGFQDMEPSWPVLWTSLPHRFLFLASRKSKSPVLGSLFPTCNCSGDLKSQDFYLQLWDSFGIQLSSQNTRFFTSTRCVMSILNVTCPNTNFWCVHLNLIYKWQPHFSSCSSQLSLIPPLQYSCLLL